MLDIPAFLIRPPMTEAQRANVARWSAPRQPTIWAPDVWAKRAEERAALAAPARPEAPAPAPEPKAPKAKVGIIAMLRSMMSRKEGATVAEMHGALVSAFPDRDAKGMLSTTKIQVKRQGATLKGDRYHLKGGKQ